MKAINKKTLSWLIFIVVSLLIFAGYFYLEEEHSEELSPYLKGISFLEHFAIHYTVGIFVGLLILILLKEKFKKQLNEPILLTLTVLWSHFPDLLAAFREIPEHQFWENIFFFHPIVDNSPKSLILFVIIDILLIIVYKKVKLTGNKN